MPSWMQTLVPGWWLSCSFPSKMYNALLVQWHPPIQWPTLPVNLRILSQFSCNCFHLNCTLESHGTSISWPFPVPCRNPPNTQLCIALFSFYGNELFSHLPNPEVVHLFGCQWLFHIFTTIIHLLYWDSWNSCSSPKMFSQINLSGWKSLLNQVGGQGVLTVVNLKLESTIISCIKILGGRTPTVVL